MQDNNILQEADKLTSQDRAEQYGHPAIEFKKVADLWAAYKGVEFTADDVGVFMMLLKMVRHSYKYKYDNLVDACGYLRCMEKIQDYVEDYEYTHGVKIDETPLTVHEQS